MKKKAVKQIMNRWYNEQGKLHREDGPAEVFPNGTEKWYINGLLHREDGPACVYANGSLEYRIHGKLHREDGPALVYHDGAEYWYINGEYRRDLGKRKSTLLCCQCKKRKIIN